MRNLMQLTYGLIVAVMVGLALSAGLDINPMYVVGGTLVVAAAKSFVPSLPGVAHADLLTELWTGEIIKKFRPQGNFLGRIKSYNQWVKHDKIHLVDIGVDPDVLINNTDYPIATAGRTDSDVSISLDKFDTTNTKLPDDELISLPYDKRASIIEQHREVLEETVPKRAIYNLCVTADTANTPVVMTSGAASGETINRKRASFKDIAKLQLALDGLNVPDQGRELVLSPQHAYDLMIEDDRFKTAWINLKKGEVLEMFGFIISKYNANPVFDSATTQKKAYGAASDPANELATSVVYYNKRAAKAMGSVTMYKSDASTDPKNRETVIGFRMHNIVLPKKNTGFAALVSATVA